MRLYPRRAWTALRRRALVRRMAGPRLVSAFADAYPEAVFAEIGANDGEQHDFLRPHILARGWTGVMVEPVPYVFERLERNFGDQEGVALANAAIGPEDGRRTMYHLARVDDPEAEGLPRWYDGIASFSREEVVSHKRHIPDIESRVVETEVECLTLESLLRRNGIDRLDLLLIDTEGYDWEILRHVDLGAVRPRVVVYEHYHLGPDDRRACGEHMSAAGFETMEEHFDTFCLDTGPDDELTRAWRRLEPAVPGVAAYEEGK